MSLSTPQKVRKLQEALHAKAKGEPGYRFYLLYDKMHREDVLAFAYRLCRSNGGAAGVDGRTFADIEESGVEAWLGGLAEELRTGTYRPAAVRRAWIPKPDGGKRPLGVPTVRDRVVQTAAVLVLGPIFEADLQPEQYAYRTGRSALDAVEEVHRLLNFGHGEVVDADLSGYFDTIPHAGLMKSVARRISDGKVLHLIKMWLTAPVEEDDGRGGVKRTTRNKDEGRGIPQGAPISPLLSNIHMRRFVLGWRTLGYESRLRARIVNYADDFVVCCRGAAEKALTAVRTVMGWLGLTVNEAKTRAVRVPEESFDFLGYTIGRCFSPKTGRPFIGTRPSAKAVSGVRGEIRGQTGRRWNSRSVAEEVERLNAILRGWTNYFRLGPVSRAYRAVESYARDRLRRWLCRKRKVADGRFAYPDDHLHEKLGLLRLQPMTAGLPWANA